MSRKKKENEEKIEMKTLNPETNPSVISENMNIF